MREYRKIKIFPKLFHIDIFRNRIVFTNDCSAFSNSWMSIRFFFLFASPGGAINRVDKRRIGRVKRCEINIERRQ